MAEQIRRKIFAKTSIVDFWANKSFDRQGNIYDDTKSSEHFGKTLPVMEDCGETTCFGCEKYYGDDTWEKNRLEKAHIIPFSILKEAKENENVENMVLLCKNCHHLAPDTNLSKLFWRWLYKRRIEASSLNTLKEVSEIVLELGLNYEIEKFKATFVPSQDNRQTFFAHSAVSLIKSTQESVKTASKEEKNKFYQTVEIYLKKQIEECEKELQKKLRV